MTILYVTVLSVFYTMNARIYMLTYSLLAEKKYQKQAMYNMLWLLYAGIIVLKQTVKLIFCNPIVTTATSVALVGYQVILVFLFYNGTTKQKVINISIPDIISFFSDILTALISVKIFRMNTEELLKLSVENIIATGMESLLLTLAYVLLSFVISKKRKMFVHYINDYGEITTLSMINFLIMVITIILVNNISAKTEKLFIITEIQTVVVLLIIIVNSLGMMRKNIVVMQTEYQNQQLECELKYYSSLQESAVKINNLRHDMGNHIMYIHEMLEMGAVEEAKNYVGSLHNDIEVTKDICEMDDKLLSILFSEKFREARAKGIRVEKELFIGDNFYDIMNQMNRTEHTALFSNILDNAIQAASQSEEKWIDFRITTYTTKIKLIITRIECSNSISDRQKFEKDKKGVLKTTKKDKQNHGLGMSIVKGIVDKYHGKMWFETESSFKIMIEFAKEAKKI